VQKTAFLVSGLTLRTVFYWVTVLVLFVNLYYGVYPTKDKPSLVLGAKFGVFLVFLGSGLRWRLIGQLSFLFINAERLSFLTSRFTEFTAHAVSDTSRFRHVSQFMQHTIAPDAVIFERPSMGDTVLVRKKLKGRISKNFTEQNLSRRTRRILSTEKAYKKSHGRFLERLRRERYHIKLTRHKFIDRYVDPTKRWREQRLLTRLYHKNFVKCHRPLRFKLKVRKAMNTKNQVWTAGSLKPKYILNTYMRYRHFWYVKT
jgi:hypothetical protein